MSNSSEVILVNHVTIIDFMTCIIFGVLIRCCRKQDTVARCSDVYLRPGSCRCAELLSQIASLSVLYQANRRETILLSERRTTVNIMNACGEFVNGCRLARQVRKAEKVEARAQRKEAKLANKAVKAVMRGNVDKATKLQTRANEMHAQAEFAHQTREGALTVMAGSSVPVVQKLGSFVAQPRRRCCGQLLLAPLKSQTVIIGGASQKMYNGVTVVPNITQTAVSDTMPTPGAEQVKGTYPAGPVVYATGPMPYPGTYPPQEKYAVDISPPAYEATSADRCMMNSPPPAYVN